MIDLNFIPEQDQKAIARYAMSIAVRHLTIWLVFAALIVALLLGWGKFFLERNLAVWKEQATLVSQHRGAVSDRVMLLNQSVLAISRVQEEYQPWSDILVGFAELVPPGNRVDLLTINSDNNTVEIRGYSTTRENVIAFEENLKASELFVNVKAPLTNLLNPRDVDFQFMAQLRPEDGASVGTEE